MTAPNSGLATTALVLGILGFFTCALTSIPAVIFGHAGMGQTRDGAWSGRGQAVAGLVLGYAALVPAVVLLVLWLLGTLTASQVGQ